MAGAGGATGSGTGAGGTPGQGGNSNPGGSSGNTGTGAGGGNSGPTTCMPGIPATTQIPRMRNTMYDAAVRDLLGVTTLTTAMNKKPSDLLFSDFDGPMVPDAWRLYQSTASTIAHEVMSGANKSKFISCDPAAANCLTQTIQTFGRKAFRRPLTTDEVTRFQKLGQTMPAGTPAEVAEATLLAFLVSPYFIYLPELTTTQDPSGQGIQLSGYEVASRLSFMLWGSVPDDMLNAAADANQLQTKDQILAQAQRMIAARDKTGPLISAFHDHWVQVDNGSAHWWKIDHDTTQYPLYSSNDKPALQSELDNFFAEVAYTGGSFKDLFLSNVGFVNKDTAAIYGLDPSKYGADLTKVQLDPQQRPGFLTRVGFLSSYSHFSDTSPILRGAFITVYMLGVNPGAPNPANLMKTAPPGMYKTNREKTDALVNMDASCKACHTTIINPSGYVLEKYDSIGKWQTVDPLGGPIDGTASVTFSASDVKPISSPLELMQGIAATPKAQQTYAEYWVSFAYGRQPNANDQCIADQLNTKLSQNGYTILTLLADLTQADSFRLRVRATP
jgi:hypothetical protein